LARAEAAVNFGGLLLKRKVRGKGAAGGWRFAPDFMSELKFRPPKNLLRFGL
jgi:hypothetical protein